MVALISTMVVYLFIFSLKINKELEREAAVDEVVKGFIRLVLVADDFMAYPYEFWHYSYGDVDWAVLTDDERPARYGPVDFDRRTGAVTPVAEERLLEPLLPKEHVRAYLGRVARSGGAAP